MAPLKQLINSRWFPTMSRPIIAGAIAAGITYALHALGVTSVIPTQINAVATAAAGLLVTAIVAKPPAPDPSPEPAPGPTPSPDPLGKALGDIIASAVAQEVQANPDLVREFALKLLESAANPIVTVHGPEGQVFVPAAPAAPVLTQAQEAQQDGVIR